MNEIIKVNETNFSGDTVLTVNARDLWKFLEVKRQYANWIKERVNEYGFIEDVDFTINKFVNGKNDGKFKPVDYHVTLEMAKHLAMMEKNEKGHKVRQYFIEVEKAYIEGRKLKDNAFKEIRDKSKQVRRRFTDTLKERGYTKQHEYIQTTSQMKKELNIEKKKEEMNELELKKIMASELIAEINIEQTNSLGYREVNPICVNSCKAINAATTALIN
jgi:phage anti-repressor protein